MTLVVEAVTDLPRLAGIDRLWRETWASGQSPADPAMMRALTHAGGYVAAAYDGEDLLGAALAFFDAPERRHLHSHLAAVRPRARGRGVGRAIKLHQRSWAHERGVAVITWTVDPLVRRNAHFNVNRLGALPTDYLVDFYGAMDDGINAGQGSDRLLMSWPVSAAPLDAPAPLDTSYAEQVLALGPDGLPVRRDSGAGRVLVQVPPDVEALRAEDPGAARAWRGAVREVLGGLMARGGTVVGFAGDGSYVVEVGQWS